MADGQVGNPHGFTATTNATTPPNTGAYADADLLSIAAMKARLQIIDAGYYTDAELNRMSYNDMQYAIRLADNGNTIRQ